MIGFFVGDWKSQALRGLAAVLFGLATLTWPELSLTAFVLLFGIFVLVDGLSILSTVIAGERQAGRKQAPLVIQGVVSVLAGLVAFVWTGITALALLYVIGTWAIVAGVLEISAAIRLRQVLNDEWMVGFAGLLAVGFGALLLLFPGSGALAITWFIGWFALISGVVHLVVAWRLRKLDSQLDSAVGAIPRVVT